MEAHLEALVLRAKHVSKKKLTLYSRIGAVGADAFERGPPMITKIHAYIFKAMDGREDKKTEFV